MFRWLTLILIAAFTPVAIFFYTFGDQGIDLSAPLPYEGVNIKLDDHGIPTISGGDWLTLVEAQGYVVAGERLFQMDLARRSAAGELAEWFGEPAVKLDRRVWEEDWLSFAELGVEKLPSQDREWCEAYAKGVNRFIDTHEDRWGVEYSLLRVSPKEWSCKDSLLVLLSMADRMSGLSRREAKLWPWRRQLPESWQKFLFPDDHPWNVPIFGEPSTSPVKAPPKGQYLPAISVSALQLERLFLEPHVAGSNSWAYRTKNHYFLANDPHLNYQVPQIWYPVRMRVSKDEWVVGVSLPGMPGVILGMNEHLAWSFTNTGEDVDDILIERVSEDKAFYDKSYGLEGAQKWEPIKTKVRTVTVKGSGPREITVRSTHRGPLVEREIAGKKMWVTRQWLGLKDGVLGLPIGRMNRAKNWSELNGAIDGLKVPAQNVVMMDRQGNIGYRVSGTGVRRQVSGRIPQAGQVGEWLGLSPPSERRRKYLLNQESGTKKFLVTANQKIWHDPFGGNWFAEDRAERIRDVLGVAGDLSLEDMEKLQVDTHSKFFVTLAKWIVKHSRDDDPDFQKIRSDFNQWDGVAESNKKIFTDLLVAYHALGDVLLARVKQRFLGEEKTLPKFKYYQQRAWMLLILQKENGLRIFGLSEYDVANYLLGRIIEDRASKERPLYHLKNKNESQHPFVGRVPILGEIFRIKEVPQTGYDHLVKAEGNQFGASVRVVYDLKEPRNSRWVFPVGQSGHVFSNHFRSFQDDWNSNQRVPLLDPAFEWE